MHPLIEKNRAAIEDLCRMHGVRRLEAFGSILRDDSNDDGSDVDALVEFSQHAADSFSNFLSQKGPLEAAIGRSRRIARDPQQAASFSLRKGQVACLCRSVIRVRRRPNAHATRFPTIT
jgi:predicted nucleotidyltransferase